jgi:hypothetical protein
MIFWRFWGRRKKSTVRVFLDRFWQNFTENGFIGIYRKSGPTKSTVLGPGPPPGEIYKIYWKLWFFTVFGPSIQPEKPSPKSASTPYPPAEDPKKWHFSKFELKIDFKWSPPMVSGKFIATQFSTYTFFKKYNIRKWCGIKFHYPIYF